jgi:hypothetical protein
MSGCSAASPGSMIGESTTAKRSKPPSGVGTEIVRPSPGAGAAVRRRSAGAAFRTSASASWSSVKVAERVGATSGRAGVGARSALAET